MPKGRYTPRWFSRLHEDQLSHTKLDDFTPAYLREIDNLRRKFHLVDHEFGVDTHDDNIECWQPYRINNRLVGLYNAEVMAAVSRLEWNRFERSRNINDSSAIVPRPALHMHLAIPCDAQAEERDWGDPHPPSSFTPPPGYTIFHSFELIVEYSSMHPINAPKLYRTGRPRGGANTSHLHHWHDNEELCIYPNLGSDKGWVEYGRSTVKWIALGVAWSLWHVQKFGY